MLQIEVKRYYCWAVFPVLYCGGGANLVKIYAFQLV